MKRKQSSRVMGISLSSRGFGYAVMEEGGKLVGYGNTVIRKNKNVRAQLHVGKLLARYQPDIMALHNVNAIGTHRHHRIKQLHKRVIALAKNRKIDVVTFSNNQLRTKLLGKEHGTKHEMAEVIASQYPEDLASRLPLKRRCQDHEDARIDIFDAAGLAHAAQQD